MKINTEHGKHLLYKGAVENVRKNLQQGVNNLTDKKQVIEKETELQSPEKGSILDKRA